MKNNLTVKDIILLWPTAEELGRDINETGGTVRAWSNRGSIPSGYWCSIVTAAEARGISLSYEDLAVAHDNSRLEAA